MKTKAVWRLLLETFQEFAADKADRLGAALAYYALFALAPLAILAAAAAGYFFGADAAAGRVAVFLSPIMSERAAGVVEEMVASARSAGQGATITGLILLVLGGSNLFVQLRQSMADIWKTSAKKGNGAVSFIKNRVAAFLAVFVLLVVSGAFLLVGALLAAFWGYAPDFLPGDSFVWQAGEIVVSLLAIAVFLSFFYKLFAPKNLPWRKVFLGAFFASFLLAAGKIIIGLYLGWADLSSVYGAAGSVLALLIWLYYTAQILLLGAEFIKVYSRRQHSLASEC